MQIQLSGFVNDLTIDVKNVSVTPTSQPTSVQREIASPDGTLESESVFAHTEDEYARSSHGSPVGRTAVESPTQESSDLHYGKGSDADTETHRWGFDHFFVSPFKFYPFLATTDLKISLRRSFDESTWGAFDNNDDADSVWGFNAIKTNVSPFLMKNLF